MHIAISSDALVNCKLVPGQRQDCKSVELLWREWPWTQMKAVVADKAYDNGIIRSFIRKQGVLDVIPYKRLLILPGRHENDVDLNPHRHLYKKRHIIERFFGRIKENKRIATRFDKLDICFSSFIALAALKAYHRLC